MVDRETNSRWLLLTAEAIDGPLKGARLEQLPANYSFWFAWADWNPTTGLFLEGGRLPVAGHRRIGLRMEVDVQLQETRKHTKYDFCSITVRMVSSLPAQPVQAG